jgi:hypothetical protein
MNVRVGMETIQLKNLENGPMTVTLPEGAVIHNMERFSSFLFIYWALEDGD